MASKRVFGCFPIDKRLVEEKDAENPTGCAKHCQQPENPSPASPTDDKSRHERSDEGSDDDEATPDVDFASMFVRKVHVLDPRQAAGLCDCGEEAIEDTGCHE